MWRALFLALGIYACIFGGECLVVDSYVMAGEATMSPSGNSSSLFQSSTPMAANRDWKPAEWAPWSLLSTGAIVILYSITLNRGG